LLNLLADDEDELLLDGVDERVLFGRKLDVITADDDAADAAHAAHVAHAAHAVHPAHASDGSVAANVFADFLVYVGAHVAVDDVADLKSIL
jgi:hypothetical protein